MLKTVPRKVGCIDPVCLRRIVDSSRGGILPLAVIGPWGWWIPAVVVAAIAAVGVYDLVQRQHSVLRNYPVLGHLRFLLEALRPELQQYFIERN